MNQSPAQNSKLILAAMIFAVSMTFIDQTIVAIAIPTIQDDLTLSATGVQWIINGYLLSLSALFAFGGRLADIAGHRRMVVLGVVIFATASALCGATPTGSLDETWLIVFRVIQGAGAAIMFPAALAIVLGAFPVHERGKAMAIFFAIAGGLTAIGPLAGGYLVEITWRAIFWVNIPVAIIALILIWKSKPAEEKHPAPLDYTGTMLITGGMGLVGPRPAAVERLGLGQRRHLGLHRRRAGAPRRLRPLRAAGREPAAAAHGLQGPRLRGGQHHPLPADDPVRAAVLLRQHVRADLARRKRLGNGTLPADLLRRLRRRLAARRPSARQGRAPAAPSSPAARSPRSASTSGGTR